MSGSVCERRRLDTAGMREKSGDAIEAEGMLHYTLHSYLNRRVDDPVVVAVCVCV